MPLTPDEIIKSLCAKAVNVEATCKKYEAPKRVIKAAARSSTSTFSTASSSSVSVASSSRPAPDATDLQSVFAKLCAKANDVEVASKVSEAASDQFGKLGGRRASNSRTNSTKVVASLCFKASSFPPLNNNNNDDQLDTFTETSRDCCETTSHASEESSSKETSISKTMESCSVTTDNDANAMTPDEFNELAKCLVTVPSGGNVVEVCNTSNNCLSPGSHCHQAPPQVVMATSRASCDASITSDVTDWDFGSSSRGGSSSSSTYDADKVVENVYRMAAADPALARRIAMAANSTKFLELSNNSNGSSSFGMQEDNSGLVETMFPVSFSNKLSTVREHCKEPKMPKLTPLARELVQHPSSTRASVSSAPPTIKTLLKKKRSKSTTTTRERPPPLIAAEPMGGANKPIKSTKRDPSSSRPKVDIMSCNDSIGSSSSTFYFVQDNPRTHR